MILDWLHRQQHHISRTNHLLLFLRDAPLHPLPPPPPSRFPSLIYTPPPPKSWFTSSPVEPNSGGDYYLMTNTIIDNNTTSHGPITFSSQQHHPSRANQMNTGDQKSLNHCELLQLTSKVVSSITVSFMNRECNIHESSTTSKCYHRLNKEPSFNVSSSWYDIEVTGGYT